MTTFLLIFGLAISALGYVLLFYTWWQFRKSNFLSCLPWILLSEILVYFSSSFVGHAKNLFPMADSEKMTGHTMFYAAILCYLIAGLASFLKCWMIAANISFLLKERIPQHPSLQFLCRQHSHQTIFGSFLIALTIIPTLILCILGILSYPI